MRNKTYFFTIPMALIAAASASAQNYEAGVIATEGSSTLFHNGGYGQTSATGSYSYDGFLFASASASLSTGEVAATAVYYGEQTSSSADLRDQATITGNGIATVTYALSSAVQGQGGTVQSLFSVNGNALTSSDSYNVYVSQTLNGAGLSSTLTYGNTAGTHVVNYGSLQTYITQSFNVYNGEVLVLTDQAIVETGPYPNGGAYGSSTSLDPTWGLTLTGGATYTTASGVRIPGALVTPEPSSLLGLGIPGIGLLLLRKRKRRSLAS
jgi:hypothetical protein